MTGFRPKPPTVSSGDAPEAALEPRRAAIPKKEGHGSAPGWIARRRGAPWVGPSALPVYRGQAGAFYGAGLPPEPAAPLLDALRATARASARSVFNDPRCAMHVERSVLGWLMAWDGRGSVRRHVALRAASEARGALATPPSERRKLYQRSLDAPRLWVRRHQPAPRGPL